MGVESQLGGEGAGGEKVAMWETWEKMPRNTGVGGVKTGLIETGYSSLVMVSLAFLMTGLKDGQRRPWGLWCRL